MIGGIQINMPEPHNEYFAVSVVSSKDGDATEPTSVLPLTFATASKADGKWADLLEIFNSVSTDEAAVQRSPSQHFEATQTKQTL